MRAHLEVAAKRGLQPAIDALRAPPLPAHFAYLWEWFLQLHRRRGSGAMGPSRITWGDLDAWARRMGHDPTPWDFDVLAALDDVFFRAADAAQPVT